MARELDSAYSRIKELLPDDWILIGMVQDSGGWRVSVGRRSFDIEQSWEITLESRAGSLLKAMNRMIDKLEQMYIMWYNPHYGEKAKATIQTT